MKHHPRDNSNSWHLVKRMAPYMRPYTKALVAAVLAMLVVALATAAFAYSLQPLIDQVMVNKQQDLLWVLPLLVLGLFVVKGLAMYVSSYNMEALGQSVISDFQKELFSHIVRHDASFYQQHTTSTLSSRFLFDLFRMKDGFSRVVTSVGRDGTLVVGLIINLFIMDWVLTLFALTVLPLSVYPALRMSKHMRRYSLKMQTGVGVLNQMLDETFTNHRQVKIYTMEEPETARMNEKIDGVLQLILKSAKVRALGSPITEILGGLSLVGVFIYGGHQVFTGASTPGTFVSFLTSVLMMHRPLKGLVNINTSMQEVFAAAERTFDLIDTPITIRNKPGAKKLQVKKGAVVFEDVDFTYGDGVSALAGLNLTIPAGQTVAIVGVSGAGKSTLLNLLPRFFEPSRGRITIDGQDIQKVTLQSLRANIGYVSQEVALFNCSILDNIRYGNPKASKAQVVAAAKAAAAHDFISRFEQGYDTLVGEFGARLSGGQRQRIAIARALLKNAPILLLDEATSNLDNTSEKAVQSALARLMKNRTTLVIAHRLTTVQHADKIYVLDAGKVVEEGTHDSLLKKGGVYKKLYRAGLSG